MNKQNIEEDIGSRVDWGNLEGWARRPIQAALRDEEVIELLGGLKSERHKPVDEIAGYRNGYGKSRKLTMGCGTITMRRLEFGIWISDSRTGFFHCSHGAPGR